MLQDINLNKSVDKEEYKKQKKELQTRLGDLQRQCRAKGIPVVILIEGFGTSGKGLCINEWMQCFDPRGAKVNATGQTTEEDGQYPFLRKFWVNTPAKGEIAIFDRGWYRRVLIERFDQGLKKEEVLDSYNDINTFERQLKEDGTLIIKFFLAISKKEQKKRLEKLLESKETSFRVSKDDLKRNEKYDKYLEIIEDMLENTNTDSAYWNIIEATDKNYAVIKTMGIIAQTMKSALESTEVTKKANLCTISNHVLDSVNLEGKVLTEEEYKKQLKECQKKMNEYQNYLYKHKIPMIIAFEGWDAAGKGGAIKRLTEGMDPRGYVVNPISAPNDIEKAHHYLWRFWIRLQKAGHVTIFDRTWYGRVMVERIEGFCSANEWSRAYQEINEFEKTLTDDGAIMVKFWLQIDKDEQKRRFDDRMQRPEKQWKITSEDWRNREKWDEYEKAVDEMLVRTSTTHAPWTIVEGNDKNYARIKVLKTVIEAVEKRIQKND